VECIIKTEVKPLGPDKAFFFTKFAELIYKLWVFLCCYKWGVGIYYVGPR